MSTRPDKSTAIGQRVLLSTASNFVGQVVLLGIGFLLTPFILRQLGSTGYGLWLLVSSLAAYGSLLDLGVWGAIIKYVAQYRATGEHEQAHKLLATARWLYVLLGLGTVALSAAIAPFVPALFNVPAADRTLAMWLVMLMGVSVGVSFPCLAPMAVLRGLQRFDIVNLLSIASAIFSAFATIIVLRLGSGVLGLVLVNIGVTLIMHIPSTWAVKRLAPDLRFGWRGASRAFVGVVLGYSWPLFVMNLSTQLKRQTDELVIAAFLLLSAVTTYNFPRRLIEMVNLLTQQFMKVFIPLAAELHAQNDQARLRLLYTWGTRLTLAIFLPMGGAVVVLSKPMLTAWVGAEYADTQHLVAILTAASFIAASQGPAASILPGMARHRPLALMAFGSGVLNLLLSIILVRPFGLTGVALGTLIPTLIESFGFVLPYTMRVIGTTKREIFQEIFMPVLLPAIPMGIILYVLYQALEPASLLSILVVAGAGFLVYVIGYLSVGASTIERQTYWRFALTTMRASKTRLTRQ